MSAAVKQKAACTCCATTVTIDCPIDPPGQCPWQMDLTISGTASGGTYRLTLNGVQTVAIAYNATFSTILTAIRNTGETYTRGSISLSGSQLSNTSTLKKFRITFIRKNLNPATPTASVTSSITGGATVTLSTPVSPLRQTLAGNGRTGRFKLTLSGVTMPAEFDGLDVAGHQQRGRHVRQLRHLRRPVLAHGRRQRAVCDGDLEPARGRPTEIRRPRRNGPRRSTSARSTGRTTSPGLYRDDITLLAANARVDDETPGTLARLSNYSTVNNPAPGFRQSYLGDQVAFEDRDHVWPYAIPKANGIEPAMTKVTHQITLDSGGGFGGPSGKYLQIYATATTFYRTEDVYPNRISTTNDPLYPNADRYTALAVVRGLIFRGLIDETDGPFPCAKSSWTIPNQLTIGTTDNVVNAAAMAIASGGTVTVTAEDFAQFGSDMPAEYTLSMKVAPPRILVGPTSYIAPASAMEQVDVTLKRVCISDVERQATNEHMESRGFYPQWYGETDDGLFRCRLSAVWDGRSSGVSFASLQVERQQPYGDPYDISARSLAFYVPLQPGYDLRPPDNSEAVPRYRLTSALVAVRVCAASGDPPSYLGGGAQPEGAFRFTTPILTAGTETMNCPSRTLNNIGCAKTYRVAWREDGSAIQVLASGDSTPDGMRSVIVTAEPCQCYENAFVLCQPQYLNAYSPGYISDPYNPDYVVVRLSATTMSYGFGSNGRPGLPFLDPPGWQVSIYTKCPTNQYYAKKRTLAAPWCPPIAVYDELLCVSLGATCNDCKDTTCAGTGNSIRVVIEIPENDREAWSERHDPDGNEPPTLIFDCIRTVNCLWKAAAAAASSGMTDKAGAMRVREDQRRHDERALVAVPHQRLPPARDGRRQRHGRRARVPRLCSVRPRC